MPMHMRAFKPVDAERVAAVLKDAVRQIGPQVYTPEQVEAWARNPIDMEDFRTRLSRGHTLVVEEGGRIIAFGQLEPANHLAFIYTEAKYSRNGIGSWIYDQLELSAREQKAVSIHTEASRISRTFFERKGYRVVEVEMVVHFGVSIERFRMEKILSAPMGDNSHARFDS